DEDQRVIAKGDHDRDRRSLHQKSDCHRVLAPDLVGQPAEKLRVRPLVMRSTVSASGNAARPNTMTFATPKSREKAANCEMIINPPVDIIVIMPNSSQNTGWRSIWRGATSREPVITGAGGNTSLPFGSRIPSAAAAPMRPRMMPNTVSVCW